MFSEPLYFHGEHTSRSDTGVGVVGIVGPLILGMGAKVCVGQKQYSLHFVSFNYMVSVLPMYSFLTFVSL